MIKTLTLRFSENKSFKKDWNLWTVQHSGVLYLRRNHHSTRDKTAEGCDKVQAGHKMAEEGYRKALTGILPDDGD